MRRPRLRPYLRHIYRDRRRLLLAVGLITLMIGLSRVPTTRTLPQMAGALLAVLPFIAMIPLFTPRLGEHRDWIEVTLVGGLLFTLLGRALPASAFDLAGPNALTPTGIFAFASLVLLTREAMYGPWSDRFLPRQNITLTATLATRLDARRVWYGLVPTPGQIDLNPDPDVASIDYADAARRTIRLVTWVPPGGLGETLIHVDEIAPLKHARLRYRVISGVRDAAVEGTTTITLKDTGAERIATFHHEIEGFPLRRALRGWLDDRLGRMMDARLDALEHVQTHGRVAPAVTAISDHFTEPTTGNLSYQETVVGRLLARGTPNLPPGARGDTRTGFRTAFGRSLTEQELRAIDRLRRPRA